ncbi:MAG TPA: TonB-dependent receptor plug domain-containing protein [Chthoniobacterales bacterium]|jgi:outer membrane receptor protein involved in Fe transport|nr:TonB-dependent receptor plug domain-containing protein [Chthoniobacterales bacterium]
MIRTVLTKFGFLRTALAVAAAIPILAGSAAFAQAPSPAALSPAEPLNAPGATGAAPQPGELPQNATGSTAETERIIVTGSNIPTAQEVGPNPVLNINRDLINKSGERSAEELIKNLPVANGGGVPISNNGTGFTPGASALSLRGLGPEATLVLVDGRRLAPYPVGNNGTQAFFDLRSIPESAIESIEILKDGASTTYGADAVAGVVNIKLRHDYKGAEATVEYGNTLDKDSGEYRGSVIFGVGDGNTQITGSMNFYHRNSIFNRDRGFSAVPPFLSSNATPYNLQLSRDVVIAAGVDPATLPNPASGIIFGTAPTGSNGFAPPTQYIYGVARVRAPFSQLPGFDFNQFSSSFPTIENYGGFTNFSHKIFGDQMVLFGDVFYEKTKSHDELAPTATGNFETPGAKTIAIPPGTNLMGVAPPNTPTFEETGLPPDAVNPFNPFNQIISGGSRARFLEFGNRLFDNTTDNFLTTIGIRGDKLFDGSWGYDTAFRYNEIKATSQSSVVSSSRLTQILNQNSPIFAAGGALAGGTAFNPFGDALNGPPIPTNADDVAFATIHPKDVDTSKIATLDLNIYTTELFKLPAGGVGFAFGGQFRRETLKQDVDQLSIDGDIAGNSTGASTNAGRKDWAIYAESNIPIFSPTFSFPGFYSLELSAAVRYEEFRNNDTNVAVPKFGLRWQPIDESLTVRATIGKGFLEPSLIQLFGSPTSALTPVTDTLPTSLGGPPVPVGDPLRTEPEQNVVFTSTPTLQPEDSTSFTAGIVWSPKFIPGFTMSIDVWDTERTGQVIQSSIPAILNREENGGLLPGEIVQRDASGFISRIFVPFINSGATTASGVDLGLQYVYPTNFGTFTSLTQVSYLDSYEFQGTPDARTAQLAGVATGGIADGASNDGFLRWRGVHRLDWSWNGFDVLGTARFTDGYHELLPNSHNHWVSQTWMFDGQASYDFTFVPPVENQPVAGYSKDAKDMSTGKDGRMTESSTAQTASYGLPIWQRVLNGTTITLGCDNIFGQDPPKAYGFGGNSTKYPGFLYDATGRFVYVQLTKKF